MEKKFSKLGTELSGDQQKRIQGGWDPCLVCVTGIAAECYAQTAINKLVALLQELTVSTLVLAVHSNRDCHF